MSYKESLHPWTIVRVLPDAKKIVVGRFRNVIDAEGHLRILQRTVPGTKFTLAFDLTANAPQAGAARPASAPPSRLVAPKTAVRDASDDVD